jgi:stearoyl-CoA desaturase (delta-9 desaturase)
MDPSLVAAASSTASQRQAAPTGPGPLLGPERGVAAHVMVYLFVVVPVLAIVATVPVVWDWGLDWVNVIMMAAWYRVTCVGVTVGFHRYFTHGAFKAERWMRVSLAIAGSLSVQGPILHWVADHRRHHAFPDRDGDPHSPWLFGTLTAGADAWLLARAPRLGAGTGSDQPAPLRP